MRGLCAGKKARSCASDCREPTIAGLLRFNYPRSVTSSADFRTHVLSESNPRSLGNALCVSAESYRVLAAARTWLSYKSPVAKLTRSLGLSFVGGYYGERYHS